MHAAERRAYDGFVAQWRNALQPSGRSHNKNMSYDSYDTIDRDEPNKLFTVEFSTLDWMDPARMPTTGADWTVHAMPVVPNSATVTVSGDTHIAHVPGTFTVRVTVSYSQSVFAYLRAGVLRLIVLVLRLFTGAVFLGLLAVLLWVVARYVPFGAIAVWLWQLVLTGLAMMRRGDVAGPAASAAPGAPLGERVH